MSKYQIIPKPGSKVKLDRFDPDFHDEMDKDVARNETDHLREKLDLLQERLYAEGKQALLCVFQAMDTGGKDGVIEKVFEGINPQGARVTSFKVPTPEELSHDFLWRVHQHVPPKGYIGIFNRSHYEEVLVVRVNELAPKKVWKKHYDHINEFERLLSDSGTRILKFYLHINKAEQKQRMLDRLADPDKHWKFSMGDLPVRERWDDYMSAYEDLLERCTWNMRRYVETQLITSGIATVVMRAIVGALEDMDPHPQPEEGLDVLVIPD
ncbi:MAG: polyphosphate kinase 2 family protein [Anaerolineae bacterium]